jgi:hypothetical protein
MNKIRNFIKLMKDLLKLNKDSVVIYQMGKVGSSSIEKSLRENGVHVLHMHKVSPSEVHFYDPSLVDRFKKFRSSIFLAIVRVIFKLRACKVITIVRDPMERTLSQMFHHIDLLIYSRSRKNSRKEVNANNLFKEIFYNDINTCYAQQWMDSEFNASMEMNYLNCDFDKEKGYGLAESKNKKVLFLRFEDLNSFDSVIGDFCGVADFELKSANRSGNKWYADLYKSFKNEMLVDKEVFDLMYKNSFYNKFYGDEYLEVKSKRWLEIKL